MKLTIVLPFLAILLCLGCAQKKSENVEPQNYFPNSVGDSFIYRVTDSVNNNVFNVFVSVVGSTKMSNGLPVNIWTYKYPNSIDTNYVFSNKDSVIFYGSRDTDPNKVIIKNVYHLPVTVGAKWRVSFIGDSSKVVKNDTLQINGKSYNNVYLIHEHFYLTNVITTRDQWFAPNIGLVKMNYFVSDFGNTKEYWQLASRILK
jgi:hypothetical protein